MEARAFVLEDGHRDTSGAVHREGSMRPATAREELRALGDFRVHLRAGAFLEVMLARVIVRLGGLPGIDAGAVERLSAADRLLLEGLYMDLNGYRA